MMKPMLFAAVAGMTLVSAHPPERPSAARESKTGYPPCSRTVTDRCIQLYERGVRNATNLARNAVPSAASAKASSPSPAAVASVRSRDDDIDVAYAGDVLQAPRADHRPGTRPAPHVSGAGAPTRVVVIRERPHPHAVTPQAVADASRPAAVAHAPTRRVLAQAASAPRIVTHAPRRKVPMRIRKAGERG